MKFLKILGILLAIGAAFIGFALWMMFRAGERASANMDKLESEFQVGRPVEKFLERAREFGADLFSYSDKPQATVVTPHPSLLFNDPEFNKKWPGFLADFKGLNTGWVEVQITGAPPFERFYFKIMFEQGRVTKALRSYLD